MVVSVHLRGTVGYGTWPFHLSLTTAVFLLLIGSLDLPSPVQANQAPSGNSVSDAKFILNIPSGGLTSDRVEEVSLGGSQVLLVVDASSKAVFKPQEGTGKEGKDENLNKVVYAVENGKCNPNKTLTYGDLFPALGSSYATPFWVTKTTDPVAAGSSPSRGSPGANSVTNYVFTNPPAEKLQGSRGSFCVQFHSGPSVTGVTTAPPSTASTETPAATEPQKPATTVDTSQTGHSDNSVVTESKDPAEETLPEDEVASAASLRALMEKELTASTRATYLRVDERKIEGVEGFVKSDDDIMMIKEVPRASLRRQLGDGAGEKPAGYYLTVIIHSSAAHTNLRMVTTFAAVASSLSAIVLGVVPLF